MAALQRFWNRYDDLLILAGLCLLLCAGFIVLGFILDKKVVPWLQKEATGENHPFLQPLVRGFAKPINTFMKFTGVVLGLLVFFSNLPNHYVPVHISNFGSWLLPVLYKSFRIAAVITVAWGLVGASQLYGLLMERARDRLDLKLSKSVARFLSAIFTVVVIAFAVVIIITELGYNVNALITGLGLGGLTIALAAKDSAANFFGGLVLVTERPFEIGDWISCGPVEGTVEDIDLRSTKIRTAAGSLTIVPNATLSNESITNWSGAMKKRQANFKLGIAYNTPKKQLRAFLDAARTMLETDPEIIKDSVMVRLSDFGESSVNVQIVFYTTMAAFGEHMRVKERVNFALLQLAENTGIEFAFPTRVLYIHPDDTEASGTSE